ncbi:hypothetical protein AB4Y32_07435 [Paraburkholderia phymatum]|uniref:Uncharacterized protein n=1 Tax=Paraburkholderia phymatum TaxID=148447 RepID=A0ACC6TWN2_9BURK
MKVNSQNNPSWVDQPQPEEPDNPPNTRTEVAGRKGAPARHAARESPQGGTVPVPARKKSDAPTGKAAVSEAQSDPLDKEIETVATEAVVGEEMTEALDEYNAALRSIVDDIQNNRDITDDVIKLAKAANDLMEIYTADTPSPEQKEKIGRVKRAIENANPGDSIDSIGKNANVNLSRVAHHSAADNEIKYGKLASTYTRAVIFDWARFHNSNLLKGTWLGRMLQRPNWAGLGQLGPYTRPGLLLGTRGAAAASYITKGVYSILSGLEKTSKGDKDAWKDYVTASMSFGQGVNELTVGIGADLGNHLAKLYADKQKKASPVAVQEPTPPSPTPGPSRAPTTGPSRAPTAGPSSAPTTGSGDEFDSLGSNDPLVEQIDARVNAETQSIDSQVSEGQQSLRDTVLSRVEASHPDVQQLVLQDATHEIAPEYFELQEIGQSLHQRASDVARDTHENIMKIDAKAQETMSRLKALGFDSVHAARASGNAQALELVRELDRYAELRRSAYDLFNKVMDDSKETLQQARTAFAELQSLKGRGIEALKEWGEKYGKWFAKQQNAFLKQTDGWPEWMKISKPLRMQMVPSAINTGLGAVSFGVALSTYLQKQRAGTLTEQDKLDFAGAVINLISGISGFIPVVGPFVSIILATVGAICNGMADQHDARAVETNEYNLKETIRQAYNRKHPDAEVAEPYDGD